MAFDVYIFVESVGSRKGARAPVQQNGSREQGWEIFMSNDEIKMFLAYSPQAPCLLKSFAIDL